MMPSPPPSDPPEATATELPDSLVALYARLGAWRRTAGGLYGFCQTQMLEWPALTLDWVADRRDSQFVDFSLHQLAVGTQALPGSLNYVGFVEAAIPVDMDELADYLRGEDGVAVSSGACYLDVKGHTRLAQLIPAAGIVHKVRAMPQANHHLTAVLTSSSPQVEVHRVDNRPAFTSEPTDSAPNLRLKGLKSPGFALEWSLPEPGLIAGGDEDGCVCLWDIAGAVEDLHDDQVAQQCGGTARFHDAVSYTSKLSAHTDCVHDLSCHHTHPNILATASQDATCRLWDTRVVTTPTATLRNAHNGGVFGTAFHPSAAYSIATCGADGIVSLWDMRRPEAPTCDLMFHSAGVAGIQWAPFSDSVLLSYSMDGNVCIWDVARHGLSARGSGDKDAPAELAFVHTGHISRVTEARWCPSCDDEWLIASVDTTNMLQVYRPNQAPLTEHVAPEAFDVDVDE
jgi:hypothetical protein